MEKELDEAKSATSSMEASKDALETELQQQKDALASLEEKLQEQKQLTEVQQEAKVSLEAKLQDAQTSKSEVEAALDDFNVGTSLQCQFNFFGFQQDVADFWNVAGTSRELRAFAG